MIDTQFVNFLTSVVDTEKARIQGGSLSINEIIAAAEVIRKTEARIGRLLNPKPHRKTTTVTPSE